MTTQLREKDRWVYGVFFGLVILFFFDLIFLGKVLLLRDTFADFIPKLAFAKRVYLDFAIPLWNPQTGCGHPFIADPYTGAAYPLNAIFYVLPLSVAHKVSLVIHATMAGFGMIALCRLWGWGNAAALLSAMGFVFSTYVVAAMEFFNIFFPLCWGPVIFFLGALIHQRVERRPAGEMFFRTVLANWGPVSVLALCLACGYLAGNPQYLVFAILLVGAYYLVLLVHERNAGVFAVSSGIFLGAGAIALLLCMPQILPFLELLGESIRAESIDPGLEVASVHPSQFFSVLFPFLFGKAGTPEGYWARSIFEFWLGAFYVGVLPPVIAGFAWSTFRRGADEETRWARHLFIFFLAGIAFGIVLACGKYLPVYNVLFSWLPGFDKVRWPSRFMLFWVYFVPLGAGLGLHLAVRIRETNEVIPRSLWIVPGAGAAVAILLWLGYAAGGDMRGLFGFFAGAAVEARPERLALFRGDWLVAAVFLTLGVAAIAALLRAETAASRRRALRAVVGLAFLNMMIVGRQVHPMSSEDVYAYTPELWDLLESEAAANPHWRIFSKYGSNQFDLYGVADPEVYKLGKTVSAGETWLQSPIARAWRSSLSLGRYAAVYQLIPRIENQAVAVKFVEMLNVRYAISGPSWEELVQGFPQVQPKVAALPNPLPRAYLVDAWERASDFKSGVNRLGSPEFDLRSRVLIEPSEEGALPGISKESRGDPRGAVRAIEYDWNRARIEVETPGPSLLVLADSWFPGWTARIDGNDAPIFKANLLFRAVELPAGAREVVFEYRPARWRLGLALCAIGLVMLAAGFVLGRFFGAKDQDQDPGAPSSLAEGFATT